jgi:hypothetical protein
MEKKFRIFVEKAGKIISDCPDYFREEDRISALNQKFRLGREEAKMLLDEMPAKERKRKVPSSRIKAFDGGRDFFIS